MTERRTQLINALSKCKIAYDENPLLFPFAAIIQQLQYLMDVEEEKTNDFIPLKKIKIGWIAVRELDGYEDQDLINLLCLISREAEKMLYEKGEGSDADLNVEVLLMQPKEMPSKLLSALSKFFSSRDNINRAYFAVAQFSNSLDTIDFLIAIDADTDIGNEINKIKKYLADIDFDTGGNKVVIVDVSQKQFNNYFSKITPFYVRLSV